MGAVSAPNKFKGMLEGSVINKNTGLSANVNFGIYYDEHNTIPALDWDERWDENLMTIQHRSCNVSSLNSP